MSVWPEHCPDPALRGTEGELVSVRISIEPRLLESVLDALARLEFPINPQIYHDAVRIAPGPDGVKRIQPTTVVEFPAWAAHMDAVRAALREAGLDAATVAVRGMLEQIHARAIA